jgi:cell division protein FtsW (lipid II flippase)
VETIAVLVVLALYVYLFYRISRYAAGNPASTRRTVACALVVWCLYTIFGLVPFYFLRAYLIRRAA